MKKLEPVDPKNITKVAHQLVNFLDENEIDIATATGACMMITLVNFKKSLDFESYTKQSLSMWNNINIDVDVDDDEEEENDIKESVRKLINELSQSMSNFSGIDKDKIKKEIKTKFTEEMKNAPQYFKDIISKL